MTALCTVIKSWIEGTITLSYITRIKEGLLRISCQHIESIQKLDQIQIWTGKFCLNNALEVKETMSWSCRVRKLKWLTRGHCCYSSWSYICIKHVWLCMQTSQIYLYIYTYKYILVACMHIGKTLKRSTIFIQ